MYPGPRSLTATVIVLSWRKPEWARYFLATSRRMSCNDLVGWAYIPQIDHFRAEMRGFGLGNIRRP